MSGTSEFHYLRTPPVPIELAQAVELPPPPERIPIDLASALEQTPPTRQTSNGLTTGLDTLGGRSMNLCRKSTSTLMDPPGKKALALPSLRLDSNQVLGDFWVLSVKRSPVTGKLIMLRTWHFGTPTNFYMMCAVSPTTEDLSFPGTWSAIMTLWLREGRHLDSTQPTPMWHVLTLQGA